MITATVHTCPGDVCRRCRLGVYTNNAGECYICGPVGKYEAAGVADLLLDYIADLRSRGKHSPMAWAELSEADKARYHEDARAAVRRWMEQEVRLAEERAVEDMEMGCHGDGTLEMTITGDDGERRFFSCDDADSWSTTDPRAVS